MTDEVWKRDEVASPCVNICVVHPGRADLHGLLSLDRRDRALVVDERCRAASGSGSLCQTAHPCCESDAAAGQARLQR